MLSKYTKTSLTYNNIKRIKDYLEILSTNNIEKEMTLDEVKKFVSLIKVSSNHIRSDILNDEKLKEKIKLIILNNKSIDKNYECTDFFYKKIQRERNDFFFREFQSNSLSLIKKVDADSSLLEYMTNVDIAFKTVDANIIYESDLFYSKLIEVTNSFSKEQNYKGINTDYVLNYLSSFRTIGVDIRNEDFYKYHTNVMKEEKFNNLKELDFFLVYDYFSFYINDLRINIKNDSLKLNQRLEIKTTFKEYFMDLMDDIVTSDELNMNESLLSPIIFRYDQIVTLIKEFKNDKTFVKLCEYVLHKKQESDICPLNLLVDLAFSCNHNNMISFSLLHFVVYNTTEHLKDGLELNDLNNTILPLFDLIVSGINIVEENKLPKETIIDFLEELKSSIFHSKFKSSQIGLSLTEAISEFTLNYIRKIHKRLPPFLFDQQFDNYLLKAISLSRSISVINI